MSDVGVTLFGDATIAQAIGWATAAIAALIVLVKAWPWLKRTVRTVDALAQLPDFIDRTDTTLESQTEILKAQNEKIVEVHHEVNFNNGSSVKDAVIRIEKALRAQTARDGRNDIADDRDPMPSTIHKEIP